MLHPNPARGRLDFRVAGGHLELLHITESCSQIAERSVGQRGTGSATIRDACLKYTQFRGCAFCTRTVVDTRAKHTHAAMKDNDDVTE